MMEYLTQSSRVEERRGGGGRDVRVCAGGWLRLRVCPIDRFPAAGVVRVETVTAQSPAAAAGLQPGDLIVSFHGIRAPVQARPPLIPFSSPTNPPPSGGGGYSISLCRDIPRGFPVRFDHGCPSHTRIIPKEGAKGAPRLRRRAP